VAYVSEGGDILTAALEQLPIVPSPALHPILHPPLHLGASPVALSVGFSIGSCLFVMVLGGITYWGRERFVAQVNNGLVAIVLIAFAGLLVLGLSQFQPEQLLVQHWSTVTPAIPVMLVALCYHNVVPIVTTQLEGDRVKICSAILVGAAIPLVLFLIWNTIILAGVSPELAQGAGAEPGIFDPLLLLRRGESGAMLGILVSLFSEVAISTSFIGFTYSLLHVLSDLLPLAETQPWERLVLFALIIGPPFVLANLNPDLFFAALDAAGAFSIAFLVGILPALMAWQQRSVWQWSTWQRSVWQQGSAQELKSQTLDQSSTGHIRLVPGGTPLLLVILGMTVMVMVQHIWEMFWEMFA
jgi:tyrosine-specific transport protein